MSEEKTEEEIPKTVVATDSPETVIASMMDEDKRKELAARLESLKGVLDRVEGRMSKGLEDKEVALAPNEGLEKNVKSFSPEVALDILEVTRQINNELRMNITIIHDFASRESRKDLIDKSLEIIGKTSIIYEAIVDQISE